MAKFIIVKETPQVVEEKTYLIDKPSFLEQITLHKTKRPTNGLTGAYFLRMIVDSIAQKYDPENMTAYSIKVHKYEGIKYSSDEELDALIVNALKQDYPAIFPKYLEIKIRNRPAKTETIIYVDSKITGQYEIFYRNGLAEEKKEVPVKPKSDKVVGKPAITKEQAETLKNQVDNE